MRTKILVQTGLLVAALGIAAWLAIENRRIGLELERTRKRAESGAGPLKASRRPARRGAELENAVAAAPNQAPGTSATPGPSMARLWDDPNWRADRFNEAYLQVEARFGRFFQKLAGWPPERLEALKRQLADNDLALMRAAMTGAENPDPTAVGEALRAAEARNQQQLKEILGEAGYAEFDASQKTEPYRESVGSIVNTMRSQNAHVSDEAEESILGAYAAAIQEAACQAAPVDPRQLSEDQLSALRRQQKDAFRLILMNKLSGVLEGEQLRAFMEAEIEQEGGG